MNAMEISPLEQFRIKETWRSLLLLYIGILWAVPSGGRGGGSGGPNQDHPFQHYVTNYHMKYEIFPPRVLILQRIHVL
jgi:hypothetical protein